MSLTGFDIGKIIAYIVGFGAFATPDVIGSIIEPFGAPHDLTTHIARIIGAIVVLATLIANTLKNPSSPTGFHRVLSSDPDPEQGVLTTHAELSAKPPAPPAQP